MGSNATMRGHREEVLRALLALLSGPMYRPLPKSPEKAVPDKFSEVPRPLSLSLIEDSNHFVYPLA
jgi:hypothetical protein